MKTEVRIANPYRVAWAILTVLLAAWVLITLLSAYSAADVRAVCAQHRGVAEVTDNTWMGGPHKATVVCLDGWVGDVS